MKFVVHGVINEPFTRAGLNMGFDVVLTYSNKGWKQLENELNRLDPADQDLVIALLDDTDDHLVSAAGNHCLMFEDIDTSRKDFWILTSHLVDSGIDSSEYLFLALDKITGQHDMFGGWTPNEFKPKTRHSIDWSEPSSCMWTDKSGFAALKKVAIPSAPITQPSPVINDYTCTTCGNNRCSRTEASCWKCGAKIP